MKDSTHYIIVFVVSQLSSWLLFWVYAFVFSRASYLEFPVDIFFLVFFKWPLKAIDLILPDSVLSEGFELLIASLIFASFYGLLFVLITFMFKKLKKEVNLDK